MRVMGSAGSKPSSSSLPGTLPSVHEWQPRFSFCLLLRFFVYVSQEQNQLFSPLLASIHSEPSPTAFSVRG